MKTYDEIVNEYHAASKELSKRRDCHSKDYMAKYRYVEGCRNRMIKHPEYKG